MTEGIYLKSPIARDVPAIIKLMSEFAEFEKLSDYLEITEEKFWEAMFGENAFVEGLVAFSDKAPIAYAIFFHFFPAFAARKAFISKIFLSPKIIENSDLAKRC